MVLGPGRKDDGQVWPALVNFEMIKAPAAEQLPLHRCADHFATAVTVPS